MSCNFSRPNGTRPSHSLSIQGCSKTVTYTADAFGRSGYILVEYKPTCWLSARIATNSVVLPSLFKRFAGPLITELRTQHRHQSPRSLSYFRKLVSVIRKMLTPPCSSPVELLGSGAWLQVTSFLVWKQSTLRASSSYMCVAVPMGVVWSCRR